MWDEALFGQKCLIDQLLDVSLDETVHRASGADFAHLRMISIELQLCLTKTRQPKDSRFLIDHQLVKLVLMELPRRLCDISQ